ncbi:nucleotide-binding universal stress UspA family protein [Nocardia transvalensis]|uniref:Nucleotide-binding universal stress UspA family protein n=1 Tax=Nocardia transvalensis TaxID=37333 RepID=A0A7W9PIC4_9NOCA|nr:universal stress protein [Nocardia transvalensis]MBB5916719.1 nucleotide-binding universal stress UspA family protein [Nocardia transvalensis]
MIEQHNDDPHRLASAPVVVGVDGSEGSDVALRWAIDLAVRRGRALQIVHGMDLVSATGALGVSEVAAPPLVDSVRAHGRSVVAHAQATARELAPTLRTSTVMTSDTGKQLLIDHSANAYMVVLGATGSAGTFAHLGTTLLSVVSRAAGVVAVVRPDPHAENTIHDSGPVVVGVDGSLVSEAAIEAAFVEAAERGADLVAVHAWSDWDYGRFAGRSEPLLPDPTLEDAERVILAERLAGWQEKYPQVRVLRKVYPAAPAVHLQEWSTQAQLLVVGSRGRGGVLGMLLGSTSNSLVQHAYCPVLVAHSAR